MKTTILINLCGLIHFYSGVSQLRQGTIVWWTNMAESKVVSRAVVIVMEVTVEKDFWLPFSYGNQPNVILSLLMVVLISCDLNFSCPKPDFSAQDESKMSCSCPAWLGSLLSLKDSWLWWDKSEKTVGDALLFVTLYVALKKLLRMNLILSDRNTDRELGEAGSTIN